MWEETLVFVVHMPDIALVRFLVWDHDPIGRDFIGQRTLAFSSMMPGGQGCQQGGGGQSPAQVPTETSVLHGDQRPCSRRGRAGWGSASPVSWLRPRVGLAQRALWERPRELCGQGRGGRGPCG